MKYLQKTYGRIMNLEDLVGKLNLSSTSVFYFILIYLNFSASVTIKL